jgi:hypothetical protein
VHISIRQELELLHAGNLQYEGMWHKVVLATGKNGNYLCPIIIYEYGHRYKKDRDICEYQGQSSF